MNPFRTNGTIPSLDDLNRTLLITGAISMLLKMFFEQGAWPRLVLSAISFAALLFALLRLFSKDPARTNTQNLKYLAALTAVKDFFRTKFRKKNGGAQSTDTQKKRRYPTFQELKQYKYFMCPQCTQRLRVPRGKGRLRVTCTRCGNRFEVKS